MVRYPVSARELMGFVAERISPYKKIRLLELQVGPAGVDNRQSYLELTYFPGSTRRPPPSSQTRS